jgi:HEAT repeat protein
MANNLTPYADTLALLQGWRGEQKQRDAPELLALRQLDHDQLVAAMAAILAQAETEVRFSAMDALPHLVPDTVLIDLLLPYLVDPSAALRWTLCELFHGYPDPRVVLPLVQVLREDTDPNVRLVAAEALYAVGDERAIPALVYAAKHDKGKDYEDRSIAHAARDAITAIQQRVKKRVKRSSTL